MKQITLKEMLEEIVECILEQKEIKDYYWKDGEGEIHRITEIDLLELLEGEKNIDKFIIKEID